MHIRPEAERKEANVVVITEEFSVSTAASPDAGRIPEGTDPAGRADAGTCWGERLIAAVADDRGKFKGSSADSDQSRALPGGAHNPATGHIIIGMFGNIRFHQSRNISMS